VANAMRWRYGDTCPVMLPVDSASVIEIGDLVYLDTDDAKPASAQADQGTKASNQEMFHDKFAGVAMQASRNGDTQPIRVATAGVFEFDCVSATFEVGKLIGADENTGGTALEDQIVIGVATPNLAIGRCAKRCSAASTRVLVDVVSTMQTGGPQDAA
jgi:uncharacterized protein DUF2190